jgi:hypothetical protein
MFTFIPSTGVRDEFLDYKEFLNLQVYLNEFKMPRRCTEAVTLPMPPRKKSKTVEEAPSLDASFYDDEALPPGIVFSDVQQKKWRIGKPIGKILF